MFHGARRSRRDRRISPRSRANVRLLSMAGNHIADFGAIGIADTIAALDRLGIAHAGADRDHATAAAPAIVVCDGRRITLLSYNCVGPQIAWADEHRANGVTARLPPLAHAWAGDWAVLTDGGSG